MILRTYVLLSLLGSGCTSIATLEGARTIPKGAVRMGTGTSLQSGTNAVSSGLGIPVPQQDLYFRYGKSDRMDVGVRFYLLGAYTDFRYQFGRLGEWDVAVAPGIGGLVLPLPGYQGGVVDLVSPIRFQRDLSSPWNVTLSGSVRIRETFTRISAGEDFSGSSGLMQILVGGGVRMERPMQRLRLSFCLDVLAQPARAVPPAVSGGVGWSWMRRTQRTRRERRG